jgi:inosose dehydratase
MDPFSCGATVGPAKSADRPPIVNATGNLYHPNMPPIIACHTNSYGHLGGPAAIESIRAAGLDYVEIPIRTAGFRSRRNDPPLVTTESTSSELSAVQRLLERCGVTVSSCTCIAENPADPANVPVMLRKLDLASHFGVRSVVADAGAAHSDDERATLYTNLCKIGDHAEKLGITVCFETHRGLCVNHREMLRTMADLAHPHLRLNFDTGNILYYNDNIQGEVALAKCCHLVKHVHLKDTPGNFGEWNFPALGRGGAVNFLRVYQIMRDCGFKGPYTIEIEGVGDEGDLTLAEYHQRVVESVKCLRTLGYFEG